MSKYQKSKKQVLFVSQMFSYSEKMRENEAIGEDFYILEGNFRSPIWGIFSQLPVELDLRNVRPSVRPSVQKLVRYELFWVYKILWDVSLDVFFHFFQKNIFWPVLGRKPPPK